MLKAVLLFLVVLVGSCSTFQKNQVADESSFGVPTEIANKFEVKQDLVDVPVLNATKAESAKTKATKAKEKKEIKAKAKMDEKTKLFVNRWPEGAQHFPIGERYLFDITYFGATAGQLELKVLPFKTIAGRKVFHLQAHAVTSSVFSLFYRLNDVGESFMDEEALFSHKFQMKLDQSLQQRDLIELYDQKEKKLYYYSKLDHKKKGKRLDQYEIEIEPFTQDGLSAFYFLRTLPLTMGSSYTFPVVTNGKMRTVRVTVVRKETLSTKIGEIPAVVVKPEVVLEGALKTSGENYIWLSDDPRRLILKVDAKIKVGSMIAYLKEFQPGEAGSSKP